MSSKDKLYQFIPDVAQSLKPAKLMITGPKTFNPDNSVNEGCCIKLKPNAALQYFLSESNPDYVLAVEKMKRKMEKRDEKFGKGKPGSIVEIPLERKEKRTVTGEDGEEKTTEVTVSNIGNIPDKYVPKTQEQTLRSDLATSQAEGKSKDAKIAALLAEVAASKK